MPKNDCLVCKSEKLEELLNLGPQPMCNRFLKYYTNFEYTHPMVFNLCHACGMIQLRDPAPYSEIQPRYEWLTYNEPERHLDHLSRIINCLPGISTEASVCGISYKEDSILERLRKLGFNRAWRMDLSQDLDIKNSTAGIETIQASLTQDVACRLAKKYGRVDIVIARHIVEHTTDPWQFISALKQLMKPNGYLVIEVPDCTQSLENFDYSMPWEEHILYFTPEIFSHFFSFLGLSVVHYESYPYPHENSLVGIAKLKEVVNSSFLPSNILELEKSRAHLYVKEFSIQREKYKKFLSNQEYMKKTAFFGAGHLACAFLNLLDLKNYIEFVVDDYPGKQGLLMPGSQLPIVNSETLMKKGIKLCLLAVNPASEEKIIKKNKNFTESGGLFLSMIPVSQRSIRFQ